MCIFALQDKEKLDTMLEVLKNAVKQQPSATILELEPSWRNIVANSLVSVKPVISFLFFSRWKIT